MQILEFTQMVHYYKSISGSNTWARPLYLKALHNLCTHGYLITNLTHAYDTRKIPHHHHQDIMEVVLASLSKLNFVSGIYTAADMCTCRRLSSSHVPFSTQELPGPQA